MLVYQFFRYFSGGYLWSSICVNLEIRLALCFSPEFRQVRVADSDFLLPGSLIIEVYESVLTTEEPGAKTS